MYRTSHLKLAPLVSPPLCEVEVHAELHPGEIEAADGDDGDVHSDGQLVTRPDPVLRGHVQTLDPARENT